MRQRVTLTQTFYDIFAEDNNSLTIKHNLQYLFQTYGIVNLTTHRQYSS